MWNNKDGLFKAYASLNVHGQGLDPAQITLLLGIHPNQESVSNGFGAWTYSTRDRIDHLLPLEDHIAHLLDVFDPKAAALQQIQKQFSTRVFCYFASQSDLDGFKLRSKTLGRLADLRLDLDVDEYFCCGETTEPETRGWKSRR